jgi:hypothetical protein
MCGAVPTIDCDRWLAAGASGLEAFERLLASTPLPSDHLRGLAVPPAPGEPYGRLPLRRGATGEVLLVRWRDDTFCAPHDHGEAAGFVALLRGRFVERRWHWTGRGLELADERPLVAPAIIPVRAHEIHSMKAAGGGVGLHVYVPAITDMRVYDCDRRETLIVADECGAWVPSRPSLVSRRTAW